MPRFFIALLTLYTCGCTHFGGAKPTSGWYALEQAAAAKCQSWPLRTQDLQADAIGYVGGPKPGFLFTGLKRDASPLHYFAPFTGDLGLDPDSFVALNLGPKAVLLGGAYAAGQNMAVVAHNGVGKATFDLRTLPGNVVKYKGDLGPYNVVEGSVAAAQGGLWVSLKSEDNIYHLVHIDTHQASKISSQALAAPTFSDAPRLLTAPDAPGVNVVWREGDTGQPFHLQEIQVGTAAAAPQTLPVAVASQLESWSATRYNNAIYLAFVDGDTMVGQAEVKVAYGVKGDDALNVKWTKAAALRDTHAQEPVFSTTKAGLQVLVLNWIDEESTIARYMVAAGTIGKPTYSGIFSKGTRIISVLASQDGEDAFVLTRSRADTRWNFQLCKI